MNFYDSDKHLIPVMMWMIGESFGRKTYDFGMARQCSEHAVYMASIGQCFHADSMLLGSATAENVAHEHVRNGNFIGAIERIVLNILHSPGHRQNLTNYPVIGAGTAVRFEHGREPVLYVAQRFRH